MNKYIRTKDNKIYVFKATERYSFHSSKMVNRYQELGTEHVCAYGQHILKEENIYKESDDICDLCDDFVALGIDIHYFYRPLIKKANNDFERDFIRFPIRGLIWTETGAKYIAEYISEKGYVPFIR